MKHSLPIQNLTKACAKNGFTARWRHLLTLLALLLSGSGAWAQTYLIGTNQTTCAGTIYDSGGPNGNYNNNENLTTVLTPATAGAKVRLAFTVFDLESGFDNLNVYNGPNAGSPLLGTFTGTTIPGNVTATNSTGQLTLVFTSDGSVVRAGFAATIACVTNVPGITSFTPTSGLPGTSVVITGTNFTGTTAVSFNGIAAPGFVVNPATQITVNVPVGATTGPIRVVNSGVTATSATPFTVPAPTVASFTPTSGPAGTSVVVTGANFTGATAVTIGGTPAPGFVVNSASQLTVSVPANAFTGPVCVSTPAGTGCSTATYNTGNLAFLIGTNQTTCSGILYDSGGPNGDYANNENLTSVLTPANGSKIVLTFTSFDLESGFDNLRIYDGPTASSPLLGTFTGTTSPGTITASAANLTGKLTLVFTSDGSITRAGFAAGISCLAPPTCTLVTNLTVTNITGTSAVLNFTPGIGNNSYVVTYTPAGGPATTVTGAASPIALTGLLTNTAYTVTVQPVCTVGTSPNTITTATFTTLLPNDDPCGALQMATAVGAVTSGSNVGATTSLQNGINTPSSCSPSVFPKDVWFRFTATATAQGYTFAGPAAGLMRVFTTPSCSAGPFADVFCRSSNANNTSAGRVTIPGLTVGQVYYLAVSGYGSSDTQGAFTITGSVATATHAQAETSALTVFPNPSSTGQLTLRLSNGSGAGQASLLNALGQTVLAQPLRGTAEQTLRTRGLATGIYTLRVTFGEQTLTRKVVLE